MTAPEGSDAWKCVQTYVGKSVSTWLPPKFYASEEDAREDETIIAATEASPLFNPPKGLQRNP